MEEKMSKHELLNTETGEIVPAVIMIRSRWKGEPFVMTFQSAFQMLAKDKEITLEARRVLDFMFGHLNFENYILFPQVAIAKELDMHKQHVSRAIKLLIKKAIILEGPKMDRSRCYKLNHFFGWKGTLKSLQLVRKAEDTQLIRDISKGNTNENLL